MSRDELDKIEHVRDMLKGNINRMCVCEDANELVKMYHYAKFRIDTIYEFCLDRFLDDGEGDE